MTGFGGKEESRGRLSATLRPDDRLPRFPLEVQFRGTNRTDRPTAEAVETAQLA